MTNPWVILSAHEGRAYNGPFCAEVVGAMPHLRG